MQATGRVDRIPSNQQLTLGRRIFSRQIGNLRTEILIVQVYRE